MRKLFGPLIVFALTLPCYPQAQPKPVASPTPHTSTNSAAACPAGYYRNVDSVCVHRPVKTQGAAIPQGASAQCRDGSYSFSKHHQGTCSHHGGVARWF